MSARSFVFVLALATSAAMFPGCAIEPAVNAPRFVFDDKDKKQDTEEVHESHSVGHALLLYIPNRIFDLFDIVRLRLRLGPGLAVGARVTELVDFEVGGYATVWAGIHGPRGRPVISWPVGVENYGGFELSFIDLSDEETGSGPHYGPAEIGLGLQALIIGADVGVEPWDALDFLAGLLFFDPNGDDF